MSTLLWLLLGVGWIAFAVVLTVRLLSPAGHRRQSRRLRAAQRVMARWQHRGPFDGGR